MRPRTSAWVAAVLVAGLGIGIAVAIASSPSSLSPDRHQSTGIVLPTPSLIPSPSPSVTTPGILGAAPRLETNGSNVVIGLGPTFAVGSSDGGNTWMTLQQPAAGSGLAVDPSNPRHAITGGSAIEVTGDAGASWTSQLKAPPGKGPYQPLAISALEPSVWFFVHQGRLLVTRDGSASWTDVSGLPTLSSPVLVTGQNLGQFFLAAGSAVFQLTGYGQKITAEPTLTQGSASDLAVVGGNALSLVAKVAGQGAYLLTGSSWVAAGGLSGPVAGGADGAVVVGNGGAKLGVAGTVSVSTNDGVTWNQGTGLPPDQTVEALAGQSTSNDFFAYCFGGDLYVSADRGRSWTLVTRALRGSGG